jgi:alpha-glucosidase
VYQGEELGLHEVWDLPDDVLDDPTWERSGHTERGRDGCRVPIPWATEGPSFGFGSVAPWLPQPADYGTWSAEAQAADPDSILALYRRAIATRNEHFAADRRFQMLDLGDEVLAMERGADFVVIVNMGDAAVAMPEGTVLVASGPIEDGLLPADTAAWVRSAD